MEPPRRPYIDLYRDRLYRGEWCWSDLFRLGPLEADTPLWEDAYAVARETMRRARHNVELIVEHLNLHGYLFGFPHEEPGTGIPLRPPPSETPAMLAELYARVGPIPLSLRAWWEEVGGVSLQGGFPSSPDDRRTECMTDPLMVWSLTDVLLELDEWEECDDCERPFRAPIAPDIYHKADISGGAPYSIALPDARADAPLQYVMILLPGPPGLGRLPDRVETNETFVEYLRRSFGWAGFPGYRTGAAPIPEQDMELLRPLFGRLFPI
jgi:hypothetical protein